MANQLPLPTSTYDTLCDIIRAYGALQRSASLEEIQALTGLARTYLEHDNTFLVAIGILEQAGNKHSLSEDGRALAEELAAPTDHGTSWAWRHVVWRSEPFRALVMELYDALGEDEHPRPTYVTSILNLIAPSTTIHTGVDTILDILKAASLLWSFDDEAFHLSLGASPPAAAAPVASEPTAPIPSAPVPADYGGVFCSVCGHANYSSTIFCNNCGARLFPFEDRAAPPPAPAAAEQEEEPEPTIFYPPPVAAPTATPYAPDRDEGTYSHPPVRVPSPTYSAPSQPAPYEQPDCGMPPAPAPRSAPSRMPGGSIRDWIAEAGSSAAEKARQWITSGAKLLRPPSRGAATPQHVDSNPGTIVDDVAQQPQATPHTVDGEFVGVQQESPQGSSHTAVINEQPTPPHTITSAAIEELGGSPRDTRPVVINVRPTPPPRYTNYSFHKYTDEGAWIPLLKEHTLQVSSTYLLEVAIRTEVGGIPAVSSRQPVPEPPRPIPEPQQPEPVQLLVTLDAAPGDVAIEDSAQLLQLPPRGNSEPVYFKLTPTRETITANARLRLHLRIYYRLNLIEEVDIEAAVVGFRKDDTHSPFPELPHPITFAYGQQGQIDPDMVLPRQMHIRISHYDNRYQFDFRFEGETSSVRAKGLTTARINKDDLEDALLNIRKELLKIVMTPEYEHQIDGDAVVFARQMHALAKLGRRLWNMLFGKEHRSLEAIGKWLKANPPERDSILQISVDQDADTFVFPWGLIYDRDVPNDRNGAPDLDGFWGIRYSIEQLVPAWHSDPFARLGGPPRDHPIGWEPALDMYMLVWRQFPQANDQLAFLTNTLGKYGQIKKLENADEGYQLLNDCSGHVVYFFAHGYTRRREADIAVLDADTLRTFFKDLVQHLDKNPQSLYIKHEIRDDPAAQQKFHEDRKRWEAQLATFFHDVEQSEYEADDSYLMLTNGKLLLDQLEDNVHLHKRPIVFLNTCDSAQITPSLSDSFIDLFISGGASCVIGTECLMRPLFADHFSRAFFQSLLHGDNVGKSLLDARRSFMQRHNPLGLAYTLFGSATVRLDPALLAAIHEDDTP